MSEVKALCVYCGASHRCAEHYLELAYELGAECARRGITVIFGGGRVGMMGRLADGALAHGGRVHGIIPAHLQEVEIGHTSVQTLDVVDNMHSRKMRMFELADAFCVLPGGFGTLDETFEIITWRQLKLHDMPIILLNHAGYWDRLLELISHQMAEKFVRPEHRELFSVAESNEELFIQLAAAPEPQFAPHPAQI